MDRQIKCVDCPNEFTFSVRDQEFFKQNNFTDPKRCHSCRAKKRANRR